MYFRESRDIFKNLMYEEGIDLSWIVTNDETKIDKSLLCYICKKLVMNPNICTKCDILYCERCAHYNEDKFCMRCK